MTGRLVRRALMCITASTALRLVTRVYGHCIFFFQAEDGIRDYKVTGVQTCALPIYRTERHGADRVDTGDPRQALQQLRVERPDARRVGIRDGGEIDGHRHDA